MSDRPILFQGSMVRSVLDDAKTQTRRIAKLTGSGHVKEPGGHRRWHPSDPESRLACPYGQPGDTLWVREAWSAGPTDATCLLPGETYGALRNPLITYLADGGVQQCHEPLRNIAFGKGRPSIHMPRWASRITLEIVSVRIERLQAISEDDARSEGRGTCSQCGDSGWVNSGPDGGWQCDALGCQDSDIDWYRRLWESINGDDSWLENPLVWVVEFKVVKP